MEEVKINREDKTRYEDIITEYEIFKRYNEDITPKTYATLKRTGLLETLLENSKEQKQFDLKKESAARSGIDQLKARIHNPANYICASTGYKSFDQLLDGGLYAGLYVLAAISSLGKTTFAVNLMDNIAASGRKVIYISLEMAEEEIIAKSISKLTLKESQRYKCSQFAKTTRQILNGKLYDEYSEDEKTIIDNAIETYKEYGENIFIYQGVGSFSAQDVREIVDNNYIYGELPPIVIIDYLQILAPMNERITDSKKNMDMQIVELKRISRDYNIPLLAISSYNRSSYNEAASFSALKESGAIEYTADVVIALQYDGVEAEANNDRNNDKQQKIAINRIIAENEEKAYKGEPQNIQVKLLKNRNGSKGNTTLYYLPKYNYYYEMLK